VIDVENTAGIGGRARAAENTAEAIASEHLVAEPERRYRYRFVDPLMPPFVLMKAIDDGWVDQDTALNGLSRA
jgi:hypothetical protein